MKYLIIGAGPAGLAFANKIKEGGENDFLVLEAENEAGGLCRSQVVDGAPYDIGGGHFLDVRRPDVNKFLFQFMPEEEWNKYDRDSRIALKDEIINHPLEANIWQMSVEHQISYLKSIAAAGCNLDTPMPKLFVDWIYWKLGEKIAEDYMISYNKKMFGEELNCLGTYWLEKLPNVSYEETLRSCLLKRPFGTQPGHAQFYYPKKYGYGELWLRMAEAIKENIEYNRRINAIDFSNKSVMTTDGTVYRADVIVTTIPWMEYSVIKGAPDRIKELIGQLKYTSIQTEYVPENMETEAHWIYYPALDLPYHRILVRHNFCKGSRGYWTETNVERIAHQNESENFAYLNKYAYPLNTVNKPEIMKQLLAFGESCNVYGLGRWGEHQHYNSDVTVERAMDMAERLR